MRKIKAALMNNDESVIMSHSPAQSFSSVKCVLITVKLLSQIQRQQLFFFPKLTFFIIPTQTNSSMVQVRAGSWLWLVRCFNAVLHKTDWSNATPDTRGLNEGSSWKWIWPHWDISEEEDSSGFSVLSRDTFGQESGGTCPNIWSIFVPTFLNVEHCAFI